MTARVDERDVGRRNVVAPARARPGKLRVSTVGVVTVSMTFAVVLVGAAAWFSLDDTGRQAAIGKVAELSYQFIVVVLLGTLLKRIIDDAQERRRFQAALRDQQAGFIHRLIDVSHQVELARVLVSANRSVRTWSEQVNERLIVAFIELRDIRHDERTATAAGSPAFRSWERICPAIQTMETYLRQLVDEFAMHNEELAELQIQADRDQSRQDEMWERLRALPCLGDLVSDAGLRYGEFRSAYGNALTAMRSDILDSQAAATAGTVISAGPRRRRRSRRLVRPDADSGEKDETVRAARTVRAGSGRGAGRGCRACRADCRDRSSPAIRTAGAAQPLAARDAGREGGPPDAERDPGSRRLGRLRTGPTEMVEH
jgi:hypothetical protein